MSNTYGDAVQELLQTGRWTIETITTTAGIEHWRMAYFNGESIDDPSRSEILRIRKGATIAAILAGRPRPAESVRLRQSHVKAVAEGVPGPMASDSIQIAAGQTVEFVDRLGGPKGVSVRIKYEGRHYFC